MKTITIPEYEYLQMRQNIDRLKKQLELLQDNSFLEKLSAAGCFSEKNLPTHNKYFSIVSLWEIAIKVSIGKLSVNYPIDRIIPKEIRILNINVPHIVKVKDLPFHHRDPFDRMIIAQAMIENMTAFSRCMMSICMQGVQGVKRTIDLQSIFPTAYFADCR